VRSSECAEHRGTRQTAASAPSADRLMYPLQTTYTNKFIYVNICGTEYNRKNTHYGNSNVQQV